MPWCVHNQLLVLALRRAASRKGGEGSWARHTWACTALKAGWQGRRTKTFIRACSALTRTSRPHCGCSRLMNCQLATKALTYDGRVPEHGSLQRDERRTPWQPFTACRRRCSASVCSKLQQIAPWSGRELRGPGTSLLARYIAIAYHEAEGERKDQPSWMRPINASICREKCFPRTHPCTEHSTPHTWLHTLHHTDRATIAAKPNRVQEFVAGHRRQPGTPGARHTMQWPLASDKACFEVVYFVLHLKLQTQLDSS
eukprot:360189-Chlamydomonas_euryale.AAC.4